MATSSIVETKSKNGIKSCFRRMASALMKLPRWVTKKMRTKRTHSSDKDAERKSDEQEIPLAAIAGGNGSDDYVLAVASGDGGSNDILAVASGDGGGNDILAVASGDGGGNDILAVASGDGGGNDILAVASGDGGGGNDILAAPVEKPSTVTHEHPALVKRGYRVSQTIGKGGYGSVLLARSNRHHSMMAIKVIEKSSKGRADRELQRSIDNEIKFAGRFDHPFLNVYHEILETRKSTYMVMDYFPDGTLWDYCQEVDYTPELVAYEWFSQLCSALEYVHAHGFAHRDVKLDNVLLDGRRRIRLADFGFCAPAKQPWIPSPCGVGLNRSVCGTALYMSPELLSHTPYHGQLADVWAAGVLLYYLVAGRYPFPYAERVIGESVNSKARILRSQAKGYDFSVSEKRRLSKQCQSIFCMIFLKEFQRKEIKDLQKHAWMVKGNRFLRGARDDY